MSRGTEPNNRETNELPNQVAFRPPPPLRPLDCYRHGDADDNTLGQPAMLVASSFTSQWLAFEDKLVTEHTGKEAGPQSILTEMETELDL